MSQLPKIADLDDIIKWVALKRTPNSAFAHITGPAATDKGGNVPLAMWAEMREACPATKLVHVVAPFKKEIMEARHEQDMAANGQRNDVPAHLFTRTYEELAVLLRKARTSNGWTVLGSGAVLDMDTVILIEVDPYFSAQFVLALNAAVVFTASFPREQKKASASAWGMATDVPTFKTWRERISWNIRSAEYNGSFEGRLGKAITMVKNDKGGRCGLLLFRDTVDKSLEMERMAALEEPIMSVFGLKAKRALGWFLDEGSGAMVLHSLRDRPDRPISDFNSVHIVVRECDKRAVYDAELQQVVLKDQSLTHSERREQIAFARRFDIPRERILVHQPHGYLDVDRSQSRPLDFTNTQTAGLLAALAEYQHWPELTWEGLHGWLEAQHQGVFKRSLKSLEKQALFHPQPGDPIAKLNLEGADRELFFELLPKVEYDARIAHFLVLPCDNNHLYIKVQVAAALTIGPSQLARLEAPSQLGSFDKTVCDLFLKSVRTFAQMGVTGSVASNGTLWHQLGLVKACRHWQNGAPRADGIGEFVSSYQQFAEKVEDIAASFCSRAIETRESVRLYSERALMSEEVYHALCKDLLRVYCTQLACVVKPPPPNKLSYIDLLSQKEMKARPNDTLMVNWEHICAKGPGPLIGFYTSLTEDPETQDIVVDDWTWIPPEVLMEWQAEVEERTGKRLKQYIQS